MDPTRVGPARPSQMQPSQVPLPKTSIYSVKGIASVPQLMAKKSRTTSNNKPATPTASTSSTSAAVRFPAISQKHDLNCRELLEDQILLIDVCQPGYRYIVVCAEQHSGNLLARRVQGVRKAYGKLTTRAYTPKEERRS